VIRANNGRCVAEAQKNKKFCSQTTLFHGAFLNTPLPPYLAIEGQGKTKHMFFGEAGNTAQNIVKGLSTFHYLFTSKEKGVTIFIVTPSLSVAPLQGLEPWTP
jgi:hypothetical protein